VEPTYEVSPTICSGLHDRAEEMTKNRSARRTGGERMAAVDGISARGRAESRICRYTEARVINEALEIARKFSSPGI